MKSILLISTSILLRACAAAPETPPPAAPENLEISKEPDPLEKRFLTRLHRDLLALEEAAQPMSVAASDSRSSGTPASNLDQAAAVKDTLVEEAYRAFRETGKIPSAILVKLRDERETMFDYLIRDLLANPDEPLPELERRLGLTLRQKEAK